MRRSVMLIGLPLLIFTVVFLGASIGYSVWSGYSLRDVLPNAAFLAVLITVLVLILIVALGPAASQQLFGRRTQRRVNDIRWVWMLFIFMTAMMNRSWTMWTLSFAVLVGILLVYTFWNRKLMEICPGGVWARGHGVLHEVITVSRVGSQVVITRAEKEGIPSKSVVVSGASCLTGSLDRFVLAWQEKRDGSGDKGGAVAPEAQPV